MVWLFGLLFLKTPWEGASTSMFCCTHPDVVPGGHYADARLVSREVPWTQSTSAYRTIWDVTQRHIDRHLATANK